jgi:D-alanyl-D-alanine carboxypeptidase/D-alanyl-D-alanine-endopeptidase (penicillin-binding protein 4)
MIRSAIVALSLVALALPGLALGAQAKSRLGPLITLQHRGARVSALVVRLDNHKILASLDPNKGLVPASTSKLYVTAATLSQWGSGHRFKTRFLATGPIKKGVLHGNLIFAGSGDPTFANETLGTLVRRLKASGLDRVTGKLIINAGYFGELDCFPRDRCQARRASHHSYDSGLSSAAINFSNLGVAVTPAPRPGSAALVRELPWPLVGFDIRNRVKTASHGRTLIDLSRRTDKHHELVTLSGHLPAGIATHKYYVSIGNADRYAGALIRAFLAESGIRMTGPLEVTHDWPPQGREVAAVKSRPLWAQLRSMLLWSNNFMADTFALNLLREKTKPPLSLTRAGAFVAHIGRKLEKSSALMHGHSPRLNLASGSGLTPASRVSARDLTALLDAIYHRPGMFPGFLSTLTVPAHTPVHMLKAPRNPLWMKRIAVKTGSFPGPFKVFALAGYIRLPDHGWGAFAVLINGTDKYEPSVHRDIRATRAALTPFLQE